MNETAGLLPIPSPPGDAARKARADLWQAVWEADQFMERDEIEDFVERVLDEIEADRP